MHLLWRLTKYPVHNDGFHWRQWCNVWNRTIDLLFRGLNGINGCITSNGGLGGFGREGGECGAGSVTTWGEVGGGWGGVGGKCFLCNDVSLSSIWEWVHMGQQDLILVVCPSFSCIMKMVVGICHVVGETSFGRVDECVYFLTQEGHPIIFLMDKRFTGKCCRWIICRWDKLSV